MTVVEGDSKAPFQYLLHRSVGEGATTFPGLLHFTLDQYIIMLSVKQGGIKYFFFFFWVFGKTQPRIEFLSLDDGPVVRLATIVKGDQKGSFSIATTLRCRGGCYSFPSILPLIRTLYHWVLSKEVWSTIFIIFGMTWSGIELLDHWQTLYPLG